MDTLPRAPTAVILSSVTTTTASEIGGPPFPSMSVAPVSAITPAGVAIGHIDAPAKTAHEALRHHLPFIERPLDIRLMSSLPQTRYPFASGCRRYVRLM